MNNRKAFWLFIISIVLVIALPLLFALNAPFEWMQFDGSTGVVGDTIGGITAPITGLVTIYFLYLAFSQQNAVIKSQEDAIKSQQKMFQSERDYEMAHLCIKNVDTKYNNIEIEYNEKGIVKKDSGSIAIARLETALINEEYKTIVELSLISFIDEHFLVCQHVSKAQRVIYRKNIPVFDREILLDQIGDFLISYKSLSAILSSKKDDILFRQEVDTVFKWFHSHLNSVLRFQERLKKDIRTEIEKDIKLTRK